MFESSALRERGARGGDDILCFAAHVGFSVRGSLQSLMLATAADAMNDLVIGSMGVQAMSGAAASP